MTMRWPIGSALGQYFFASAALITATAVDPNVSRSVKVRPRASATPSARK